MKEVLENLSEKVNKQEQKNLEFPELQQKSAKIDRLAGDRKMETCG